MDAFEARQQFTTILQRLNASGRTVEVGAQFLNRNLDLAEDLLQCMRQLLDKESLLTRINILYFIEHLCGPAGRRIPHFTAWLNHELVGIALCVVPPIRAGLANVEPLKTILESIKQQGAINAEKKQEAQEALIIRIREIENGDTDETSVPPPTREEILQRMDEDRERTKKVKESLWAVDLALPEEFDQLWASLPGLTQLDKEQMDEDNSIAQESRRMLSRS